MKPAPSSSKSPAPQILTLGMLRVIFTWQADRWEHTLEWLGEGVARTGGSSPPAATAWQSVASLPGDDPRWPASPPLVELTVVTASLGMSLVGLGLAGSSHFSASVGPDPEDGESLRFELACRVVEPGRLGSTYAAARASPLQSPGVTSGVAIEPLPGSLLEPVVTGTGCGEVHAGLTPSARNLLRIRPAGPPAGFPATIRWGYRMRVAPPSSRRGAC
jgi:hypothetical protein